MDQIIHKLIQRLDHLSDEFRELREGVQRVLRIADDDPEMALTRARKVLEYIIREVFLRRCGEEPGTRPLENLLQRLVKEGFFPVRLDAYANTIRKLGNVGTHNFGEKVTSADVQQSLVLLLPILEWYFDVERPDATSPADKNLVAEKQEPALPTWSSRTFVPMSIRDHVAQLDGFSFLKTLEHRSEGPSFLVEEQRTGKRLVIRACQPDPDLLRQCLRNARIAVKIDHPFILKVLDIIEEGDRFLIVQEYREGLTLRDFFHGTQPNNIPDTFRKIAEALQHAHGHGLIHGDLTPSAMVIDDTGHPHLQFPGIPSTIGTPAYGAPELFTGSANERDGRVDIWSVGIMFYECLTGRRPFEPGPDYLRSIQGKEPTPPRQYLASIPPELERICLRCLALKAAERYSTAADLAADLEAYLAGNRSLGSWSRWWPFGRKKQK